MVNPNLEFRNSIFPNLQGILGSSLSLVNSGNTDVVPHLIYYVPCKHETAIVAPPTHVADTLYVGQPE